LWWSPPKTGTAKRFTDRLDGARDRRIVPVHGEFANYAAIGIWNSPWQWCRHA